MSSIPRRILLAAAAATVILALSAASAAAHPQTVHVSGTQTVVDESAGLYRMHGGLLGKWYILTFDPIYASDAMLVASGTGTLNQYIEREFDAQMRRTACRPLAAGRLKPGSVLWFGLALSVVGSVYLAVAVNILASLLGAAALVSYLFIYTPLKRKTPLCTLVGAFPGAMPPLIGWAAASGKLNLQAWPLYAMLFLWQFPHFMAIAWMYREDYDRAAYRVLPRDNQSRIRFVNRQILLPLSGLIIVSFLPALTGQFTTLFCVGSLVLSVGFLYYGGQFVISRSTSAARQLLAASIIYLPTLFFVMVLARV